MKLGPAHRNLPASLIEFCRMQRMISPNDSLWGTESETAGAAEISPDAQWMSRLGELPDVRKERVQQLRAELGSGTYDIDSKVDHALDRMIDELPVDDLGRRIINPRRI